MLNLKTLLNFIFRIVSKVTSWFLIYVTLIVFIKFQYTFESIFYPINIEYSDCSLTIFIKLIIMSPYILKLFYLSLLEVNFSLNNLSYSLGSTILNISDLTINQIDLIPGIISNVAYYPCINLLIAISNFIDSITLNIYVKDWYIVYNWCHNLILNLWVTTLILYFVLTVILLFNKNLLKFKYVYISLVLLLVIQLSLTFYILITESTFSQGSSLKFEIYLVEIKPLYIYIDKLASTFMLTVYVISSCVTMYQWFYIEDNVHSTRFLIQLHWFVISMVLVIISGNWILLLLSWEMLGQTSFFLISFYKMKISSMKSSFKAFTFNRISDLFLLIAFLLNYRFLNSMNIEIINYTNDIHKIIIGCVVITSLIKSAQSLFYFWLPDSMEAPVPASALIHSATLVSAGFYITLRFIQYLESYCIIQQGLLISSLFSMVIFSLIASFQTDIKKLLAFSTISNCAFIYFLISLNLYDLAILYFTLHGLFKSYSFMVAGVLIRDLNHSQDIRNWNSNDLKIKTVQALLCISILALASLPITFGYEIKSNVVNMNIPNWLNLTLINLILIFYTLNSYNYAIKVVAYFVTKKNITHSYINNFNKNKDYSCLYIIFLLYFIIIMVMFLQYSIPTYNIALFKYQITFITVLLPLNIIIIKFKLVNKSWLLLLPIFLLTITVL